LALQQNLHWSHLTAVFDLLAIQVESLWWVRTGGTDTEEVVQYIDYHSGKSAIVDAVVAAAVVAAVSTEHIPLVYVGQRLVADKSHKLVTSGPGTAVILEEELWDYWTDEVVPSAGFAGVVTMRDSVKTDIEPLNLKSGAQHTRLAAGKPPY
jgi:hypothetical protein